MVLAIATVPFITFPQNFYPSECPQAILDVILALLISEGFLLLSVLELPAPLEFQLLGSNEFIYKEFNFKLLRDLIEFSPVLICGNIML